MKHLVIPDTQCKSDVDLSHMEWAGNYAAEKRPDKIIHIGDHWDMPSLSSYDAGKKVFEGRTYKADIEVGNEGMAMFMKPILREINNARKNHKTRWEPTFHFFIGNHEDRITRAINIDRKLDGLIGFKDFDLEHWNVYSYLQPIILDSVAYCHYFVSGLLGRPVTSARALLTKKHMSCVMGHVQRRDIAYDYTAEGHQITGIFAGTYYQHDEVYLTPQGNKHWRGIWMLHDVQEGSFDEMPVSLKYLGERYA